MLTEKLKKTHHLYSCESCLFYSNNKNDYNRHNETIKHNANKMLTHANGKNSYTCSCGKSYKHRSSLTRHNKTCMNIENYNEELGNIGEYDNNCKNNGKKVELLEKQVETMTNFIKELVKNIGTNNTIIGDHNNMNINKNEIKIYLSEKCSNALSIQDFAKQLAITFDDLNSAKDNTVQGITHIVEKNLKPLSFTERPMHCIKDNEWYVKDKTEGWNEDDGDTIIIETHKKIQKECLESFCNNNMTINNSDLNISDNVINLISFGTSDLRETEKQELKKKISNLCIINKK